MKNLAVMAISLFLVACGGNASTEFVGTWEDVKSEHFHMVIQKQGDSFIVESQQGGSKYKPDYVEKSKSVWNEKDGILTSPEYESPILFDKASNQIEFGNHKLKKVGS